MKEAQVRLVKERGRVRARPLLAGILSEYMISFALIGILFIFALLEPRILNASNLLNVVRIASIIGLLAIGSTYVIIAGGIDLSVGSMLALSGVIAAGIVKDGWNLPGAMIFALVLCAVLGIGSGLVVTRLKVQPFIVTLGMMTIAQGIAFIYTSGRPVMVTSDVMRFLGNGYIGPVPVPVIIFALTAFVASFFLELYKIWQGCICHRRE